MNERNGKMSVEITRLYGLAGAEYLHTEPESCYETDIEDYYYDVEQSQLHLQPPVEIEEWDVHPPEYHMPNADRLLEWIEEWTYDMGEIMGEFELPINEPEVKEAAETLLTTIASKTWFRMARNKLGSLWVTWTEDGEPLLDGKQMYTKTGGIT